MTILDDKDSYLGDFSKICTLCKHLIKPRKCLAFAKIPDEIWLGENNHKKPFKGDNGIQFEKKDKQ